MILLANGTPRLRRLLFDDTSAVSMDSVILQLVWMLHQAMTLACVCPQWSNAIGPVPSSSCLWYASSSHPLTVLDTKSYLG